MFTDQDGVYVYFHVSHSHAQQCVVKVAFDAVIACRKLNDIANSDPFWDIQLQLEVASCMFSLICAYVK